MRLYLFFFLLLAQTGLAQATRRGVVYSAASDWQQVTLPPTASPGRPQPAPAAASTPTTAGPRSAGSDYRPAFTGDFSTNRNGWKAGLKGDYQYQIGMGRYNIQKRNVSTQRAAFSFVPLPPDINLNLADNFTIKVDVVADSGRVPTGGLVFGVSDSLNYAAFTLSSTGNITIVRIADGQAVSDYMPGEPFRPGVPVDKNRNRLTIRRKGRALYFYINEQEVRSSPYLFNTLPGNGIGVTSTGYWTSFQKLSVTLGEW